MQRGDGESARRTKQPSLRKTRPPVRNGSPRWLPRSCSVVVWVEAWGCEGEIDEGTRKRWHSSPSVQTGVCWFFCFLPLNECALGPWPSQIIPHPIHCKPQAGRRRTQTSSAYGHENNDDGGGGRGLHVATLVRQRQAQSISGAGAIGRGLG